LRIRSFIHSFIHSLIRSLLGLISKVQNVQHHRDALRNRLCLNKNVKHVQSQTWEHAIEGFSLELTGAQAKELSLAPTIDLIEEDYEVKTLGRLLGKMHKRSYDAITEASVMNNNDSVSAQATKVGWNMARIGACSNPKNKCTTYPSNKYLEFFTCLCFSN
jgi:hypothetical protein